MTMFQKPNVGIAFGPDEPAAEEQVHMPRRAAWANTAVRRRALTWLLALLCVGAFVYPTINGAFLPGDDVTVRNNPALYSIKGITTIWGAPQRMQQLSPVAYTVYLVEHQFFVGKPRGYRIISIAVHIFNALLLWYLLRRLELPGAWLAAALFAIHPVQVDAVSWISQQRYLICVFFYLCALLVYLRRAGLNPPPAAPLPGAEPLFDIRLPESDAGLYALSSLLFLLALLSHPLGGTFPLIVLVLIWWERGKLKRRDILPLIPFAAASAAFMAMAAGLYFHRTASLWLAYPGGLNWIAIWGRGAWTYLLATVLPLNLSFAYPRWDAASMRWWHWLFPIAAIFVVAGLWRRRRLWGRGPITAALLFICLLLPSALGASDPNDGDLPGVMIREHVLYLACAAILVPLASFFSEWLFDAKATAKLAALPGVMPLAALAIVFSLSLVTAIHARAYEDPRSLWEDVLHSNHDSTVALNTLGELELDAKEYGAAEQHFRAALQQNPEDPAASLNLARVAEAEAQHVEAIRRYFEVLALHPNNVDAHFGLGQVLAAQGDTNGALQEYDKVQKIDPRNPMVFNNRGLIFSQLGKMDQAMEQYKESIVMDPRFVPAYLNLANAQFQQQKFQEARDTLEKVLVQVDPQSYIGWLNAGVMAESLGDSESADKYFRLAIYFKYDCADAFDDLGVLLMRRGDLPGKTDRVGEALYCFKRAAELDPANPSFAQHQLIAQQKKDAIIREQQQ